MLEDVQLGEIGLGFVQILQILPAPAKGLALHMLDAAGIDAPLLQNVFVFGLEVIAHHADDAHIGKKAGRHGEVRD